MTVSPSLALKIAAALWVVWGLVHALAGVAVMAGPPSAGFAAINDALDPAAFATEFHPGVGAVLNQHGWNLLWFGVATIVGAVFIWRGSRTAIWVTAMVGGLADVGYFVFIDLAGAANVVPGTVMTLISGTAIVISAAVWLRGQAPAPV